MPQYEAEIPNGLLGSHTLHDTTLCPRPSKTIHFRVTTAGLIRFEDQAGNTEDLPFDAGTYDYPFADVKRVHLTGLTAVLAPANTVFIRGHKDSG